MEAVGLVVGVAALWESCVQVFQTVDSARRYGMEYEVLSVKLEVERVRLLTWGDAIGLSNPRGGESGGGNTVSLDIRLQREEIRGAVTRLLSCIQHVFENSERLQEHYGLRPSSAPDPAENEVGLPPTQSHLILSGVFKRAYDNLRRVARERQRSTPLARKTVWAVHDRVKFMALVAEIRSFNDSLESLFPDAQIRVAEAMRGDIDSAMEVRELQLLQEAMAGEHEVLSDCASQRLEVLGATVSARTELLTETVSGGDSDVADNVTEKLEEADEELVRDGAVARPEVEAQEKPEIDELTKRLRDVELYVQKRSTGALTVSLVGPFGNLAHVSAHVYRDGSEGNASSFWDERDKGFVKPSHASFEMYKKRKYTRKLYRDKYESPDSEDYVLLDPESHVKYENVNPGTVTVEGFGLECWDFENTKPREQTILVNRSDLPVLPARKLLRRVADLQGGTGRFGWNPEAEELNLKEFVGTLGIVYYDQKYAQDRQRWIGDLYSLLNRSGDFADFTADSTIGVQSAAPRSDEVIGIWNFIRQMIVAKELAMRLGALESESGHTGFTHRVLATLIVSDLWFKHVKIVLINAGMNMKGIKKAETAEEKAQAEAFKEKGNEAIKKRDHQKAVDYYTEAMEIDLSNAVYPCNRSGALMGLEKYDEAEDDAFRATILDPKYSKAWSRLGMAMLKNGQSKRATKAYKKALELAGSDATQAMHQGLADAEAKTTEKVKAINSETDKAKQHKMASDFLDEDWEIAGKSVEWHSLVHEQQVEGLLLFAERMRWPYINDVRDYAEDIYSTIHSGGTVNIHLHDWLYGMILPGKWFAFKIMSALVLCSPHVRDKARIAHFFDCGLSLETKSYWRSRTVLGRVLGCLPGVIALCGWIGPCPPVEFDPPMKETKPRHIRVKTRRVATIDHVSNVNERVWGGRDTFDAEETTRIRPDEEINPYLAEMKDSSKWFIPEPPVREISTCKIRAIQLKKLPLTVDVAQRAAQGEMEDIDVENETEYRATLIFKMDDNQSPVTYKLFTSPVFVSLPPCRPGPKGPHEVHMRELHRYQNIWTIERLKDHTPEDFESKDVMIINATGKGAEVLARAWCSERGKNAVIRRAGGPCFVCAVRAARKGSLDTGVLIWID